MSKKDDKGLRFFGIPKMMPLIRKYKKEVAAICFTNSVASLCYAMNPVFQRYALNHFVGEGTLDTLWPFIALYILGMSIMVVCNYFNTKIAMATEALMNRDMRNSAFRHLQTLSFDYYNQNSVGYIHARVMSDTSRIGELFTWQVNDVVFFALYIVLVVGIMLSVNVGMTMLIAGIIPVIAVFFSFAQGRMISLNREVREINSKITGNFNEGITGAKTIKSLVVSDRIEGDFETDTSAMYRKSVQSARVRASLGSVMNLASSTALALVLWKGGVIASSEVGTFSMFMTYAQNLMEPVRWLVDTVSIFITGQVNIERYTRLMETVPNVNDTQQVLEIYGDCFDPKRENWEEIRGDIEFEHVDFKYPDGDEYVLEDFNLKIPFGTNLAIVGETGAGKSTLANLICRFYEPTAGRVLIDGRDSRERSQLWLHSALGYVLQAPHLFSGTVRENLKYGNENASDEEIRAALDLVSARSVVEKLEKGLDSQVGEGGDMLSTGEKQLLSFARAILADPRIIVLDEATASVDTLTEQKIQAAIDTVIKGRTSIVIAHRLSTIRNADMILVVSGGKIVEQGRHDELLAKKGHYYRLWTRQYEDEATSMEFKQAEKL